MTRRGPVVALVAMILVWGYSWIFMKVALEHSHPIDFAALRVGIAGAMLFAIVKLRGRALALPGYRMAIVLGLVQIALFIGITHVALLYTPPGRTAVLVFTMPFWLIVFAHFVIPERMRGAQWIAVVLAFAGLVLIVAPWNLTDLLGSLLAVSAGMAWAVGGVLNKKWPASSADPLLFTAWQMLFGLVALSLVALAHSHAPIRWTGEFVVALLFSGLLASGVGWWMWTYLLKHTSAGVAGLNTLGVPVVAVLGSAIHLGERPPATELAGMILIGAALALLGWLGIRGQTT